MSYLNALRLHFAGKFQANVSTVNNDPLHFDNAAFLPSYQEMQSPTFNPPNGWFNPQGDAAFRLLGCQVTSAWMPLGAVDARDPVLSCVVADSDGRVPGKIVDLDPEQQLVSELWGLQIRIADSAGNTLLCGDYDPAPFYDIWDRATGQGGDVNASSVYQSVLTNLRWGDTNTSPFLSALQSGAASGRLSIKFNVDGINMDFKSSDFMCGRIVGTIGPWAVGEPKHMVIGRQLMAASVSPVPQSVHFFLPQGQLNFCAAVVDEASKTMFVDLGNALPTATPGGPIDDLGDLTLSAYDPIALPTQPAGTTIALATIPSGGQTGYAKDKQWYARTAGVVALALTDAQLALIAGASLVITGKPGVLISEWPNGAFVRADLFVHRMNPGETVKVPIYATQFGRPLPNTRLSATLDPSQLQMDSALGTAPPVATPDSLSFENTITTDANGIAILTVTAGDPGTPRWFDGGYGIDGQVYGIRPAFADPAMMMGAVNQWNFVSFLVWSGFTASSPVTWTDVQPIFQQYANLYPVMNRFLNLGDLDAVKASSRMLSLAFSLPTTDPNSMPVTRDLSQAKRDAILAWLKNPLPGVVAPPKTRVAAAPTASAPSRPMAKGGKAAAAARRLVKQAQSGERS